TITDKSGKYAPISVGFEVKGDSVQEINTASLEKAIQSAEALKEADYTADSWKALQVALKNAKSALEAKKDQTSVDESTEHLNAAIAALVKAETKEEYKYVYAALSYQEYWGAEGVQAAGSSVSSDTKDTHGEYDKGAFDAVTRATTNHGLHRGNFQQDVTIYDTEGNAYDMAYWDGKTKIVLTDGTSIGFSRGTITLPSGETKTMATYKIKGIKYVPVQVAAEDYDDFKAKYTVVENGDTLAGGYGEGKLSSYSGLVAEVDANTNGLKKATKNADGTYSFGKRQTGTGSGIKDVKLQSTELTPVVQDTSSYGDFIRMDVKENYGEVGAKMQTVVWTYYGDGDTPLAAYGTKFAADNWMHKSNGIQLGLTDSLRCNLPEGKDGTGKWTVTIYALGYADTTMTINVTADDIHAATPVSDTSKLEAAVAKADALNKDDYTEESWSALETELKEAKADLAAAVKGTTSQESVDESTEHLNAAIAALVKAQKETYVLMNIPYDQFYKADVNNNVKVDAFTSATKNKVRTGSLAGGSYHVDASGDEITGVTFPVKVPAGTDLSKYTQITDDSKVSITVTNRGKESTTDYTGKDALFESASYSYYTLSEKPSYYKELTVNEDGSFSFGATQGTAATITEGVTAELKTDSRYGDYQLDLEGLTNTIPSGTAIYGVIVSTKEGSDYGMRHLENIYKVSKLAWATGFTSVVHGCPTSSEHYKAMMGQHINKVTYYTAKGIYEIPVGGEEGLYVPVKFDTSAVTVADAELKDGGTSVATTISGLTLPESFDAEYTVDGATAIVKGEKLILKDVKKGAYTLTITDKSGKYAPISVGFEVYAETIPASYNENAEKPGLTKAAGSTDAEFADYIKNITSVSVNGKSYAASGRGAVKLFNDDGTLITDAAPFAEGDSFEIVVSATGYKDLSFTYKKASSDDPTQEVNTASLEKAIQTAEALKEADYTADSWKVLQVALKNAKSALEAKKDQTSVDNAAASLNKAIEALVKADGSTPTPTPTTTPTTTPAASKNNTTTSGTGNKTTTSSGGTSSSKTAKTGDPTNIFEMLGLAVASLGTGGFALKRRKRNKK
ncbi:penicillin-binding Tp47 domain C-containing protein, partial [Blautia faecicola]|uniref:penicillin-binding Tp47 domain C-containing protein n=1 Tax=Blautia faecicola TaxID=2509240 RepID=UPI003FD710D0